MERLGDVIVGAGVKALHLVAPAVARGEDQHRHGAPGLTPGHQDGDAVLLGQSQIENDGVVWLRLAEKQPLLAIESAIDGVTRAFQCGHELAIEVFVILDDEKAQGGLRSSVTDRRAPACVGRSPRS